MAVIAIRWYGISATALLSSPALLPSWAELSGLPDGAHTEAGTRIEPAPGTFPCRSIRAQVA